VRAGVAIAAVAVAGCDLVFAPGAGPSRDAPMSRDGEVLTVDADRSDAPPLPDAAPDGMPGVDTDGDGVFDPDDNCVNTYNPEQHDKDADGAGDLCDPCPHLPGSTGADLDDDGDRLGNGCDPRPTATGDTAAFYGFYLADDLSAWNQNPAGAWFVVADGTLRQAGSGTPGAFMIAPDSTADVQITLGARAFDQAAGNIDHYIAVHAGIDTSHEVMCQASVPTGGAPTVRAIETDDNGSGFVSGLWFGAELIDRDIRLTLDLRPPNLRCTVVTEPLVDPTASVGYILNSPHSGQFGFETYIVAADVSYLFVAHYGGP
jgi:hypothetical protein